MILIGIDPGGTTGLAVLSEELGWHEGRQFADFAYFCSYLETLLTGLPPGAILICEDYIGAGQRDRWSNVTRDVIGAVKSAAARHNVTLHMEAPQKRKAFVAEARALLSDKHEKRHQADAMAHILSWKERHK